MFSSFAALTLVLTSFVEPSADEATKKDMELMQGEWLPVMGTRDGQAIPEAELKSLSRKVTKDVYEITIETEEGVTVLKGTFTLDATKSPKTIDAARDEGPMKGQVLRGIYEFEGDQLKICLAPPNLERPTEMVSKEGTQHVLIVWRRPANAPQP